MEATTLESAVDLITAPTSETDTTDETNLSEAAESLVTEPDDGQTGQEIEAEEGEDVAEVTGDDLDETQDDDQIDDEDHVETEVEDTNTFTVKVDGKEENWTLDQLKQSAAGQAAINKRFQEHSEAKKALEQRESEIQAQQARIVELYQHAQNGGFQAPVAPSVELLESDPIGYMQEKAAYDNAMAAYSQNQQQIQHMQQQQAEQQAQAHAEYLREQTEVLQKFVPDFNDPEKGAQVKSELIELGGEYGFTPDEMGNVSDARYIRALNDARKYRQIVANRSKAARKSEKARPVVKAGAKVTANPKTQAAKQAKQRLQKTGAIDDAMALILNQ